MPLPDVLQSPQQFAVTTPAALRQQAAALSVAIHLGQAWGEEGGWLPPALVSFGWSVTLLLVILGCACFRVLKTFDELSLSLSTPSILQTLVPYHESFFEHYPSSGMLPTSSVVSERDLSLASSLPILGFRTGIVETARCTP